MSGPRVPVWPTTIAGAGALLAPALCEAHAAHGSIAGFAAGFVHPFAGLDHVVAMVAVGLWGAQLGAPAVWRLPLAFPLLMALGGVLGAAGIAIPGVEIVIAGSALVLGALVLAETAIRGIPALMLVGAFGLFHGHAHGVALSPAGDVLGYATGFVLATGLLHASGIAVGAVLRRSRARKLIPAAGALIAVTGAAFLWRAVQ